MGVETGRDKTWPSTKECNRKMVLKQLTPSFRGETAGATRQLNTWCITGNSKQHMVGNEEREMVMCLQEQPSNERKPWNFQERDLIPSANFLETTEKFGDRRTSEK